jgi:hypothetical protein
VSTLTFPEQGSAGIMETVSHAGAGEEGIQMWEKESSKILAAGRYGSNRLTITHLQDY